MAKSNRKAPDRVILFETGVILALLIVNWGLHLSYVPSVLPEEDPIEKSEPIIYFINPIPEQAPVNLKRDQQLEQLFKLTDRIRLINNKDIFTNHTIEKGVKKNFNIRGPAKRIMSFPARGSEKKIDTIVDYMPEFPGGYEAMQRFVQTNFNITGALFDRAESVSVLMGFVVGADGTLRDIRVLECSLKGLGAEEAAIDVMRKMPDWEPGYHNGFAVNVFLKLPIQIQIN